MHDIQFEYLHRLAERYGFTGSSTLPPPWIGATSRVYPWGDVVIKVPFPADTAVQSVLVDAQMNAFLRARGIAVPALRVLDETGDIGEVPVAIYDRVAHAIPLSQASARGGMFGSTWEAVGRQIARIHAVAPGTRLPVGVRTFRQTPSVDPHLWVNALRARVTITANDADWLDALIDQLSRHLPNQEPIALCHGDLNATNVLVDERTGAFRALIDFAGAGWLDPAWDFAGVAMTAIPHLLVGHRSLAPVADDRSAEARICWCQLQTRLFAASITGDDGDARRKVTADLAQIRTFVARYDL
ncbi:MAG: phosphotransferase family protein [Thermomicrobiales bacterium]